MFFSGITNFILFNAGWFACILGSAWHMPWIGATYAVAIITLHTLLARDAGAELKLILCAGLYGLCADTLLASLGWVQYTSGTLIDGIAPYWIVALWMLFATTLNVTFRWLKHRYLLAAVLGAIAGPMTYLGGGQLGAATLMHPTEALITLALIWGSAMPLLIRLSERWDGVSTNIQVNNGA